MRLSLVAAVVLAYFILSGTTSCRKNSKTGNHVTDTAKADTPVVRGYPYSDTFIGVISGFARYTGSAFANRPALFVAYYPDSIRVTISGKDDSVYDVVWTDSSFKKEFRHAFADVDVFYADTIRLVHDSLYVSWRHEISKVSPFYYDWGTGHFVGRKK